MANVTISVPERVLEAARQRALSSGTSVNALVREYLEAYAGGEGERLRPFQELMELAGRSRRRVGLRGWTRDELHERR